MNVGGGCNLERRQADQWHSGDSGHALVLGQC